jgi:hypothetical protein
MCTFDTLYIGKDGYVVRCTECNHYQIAAGVLSITLAEADFAHLKKLTSNACIHVDAHSNSNTKCFAIGTPFNGVDFLFNAQELLAFNTMLEAADNEAKALSLMAMFNTTHQ